MEKNAAEGTPRRKTTPSTKVKVVASRYAQAIQRTNLEAKKTDRSVKPSVASSSSNAASIKVGSHRIVTSKSAAQTRTGVVSTSVRTPVPSTPVVTTTARRNSKGAESTGGAMSLSDKLRAYRANKAIQRPGSTTKASRSLSTDPGPRPAIPERITPPTKRIPPRMTSGTRVSGVSTPTKRRITTPSRSTPSTIGGAHVSTPKKIKSGPWTVLATRVPTTSTEEELELLEAMYVQLCFAEATADDSFRRQEQSAERQLVTAWSILQSKLQLLHDTTIRLDREMHIHTLEEHLEDQADLLVRLGSVIAPFGVDLQHITTALEASLQRMPTPGVVCNPSELKRYLEGLASTLDGFQRQLEKGGMGSTVADALSFTQGMEESTEQICSLLLQVGHLLEEIQLEVNTETSLKAHLIQEARVQQQFHASVLW